MTGSGNQTCGEDDPDLFKTMAFGHRQPELARAAWSTLILRYGGWLLDHIKRRYGISMGGDAGVHDLSQDVWVRVYARADTYTRPRASTGPAETELWTKGWLKEVCRTEHLDQLRVSARLPVPQQGTGEPLHPKVRRIKLFDVSEAISDAGIRDRDRQRIILETITALPDRERDIVHVSFQWYCPDDQECRIPAEELKYLCERWSINEAYIRQIRKRVLKRIEAELSEQLLTFDMTRAG
jgi:DNA-directed RNA polymerase specialized sigma24 family protein